MKDIKMVTYTREILREERLMEKAFTLGRMAKCMMESGKMA